eukprot:TRINITY_DN2788_c0_g1_i1.p1 TRINITY_DN2788_c0_g1~~TRINITY_DN2788_c0_g1_i1.p1  ORF type:complete len:1159 (-),score=285.04 TRINITY_DN2788_c0_g1_i1:35-3511(-)
MSARVKEMERELAARDTQLSMYADVITGNQKIVVVTPGSPGRPPTTAYAPPSDAHPITVLPHTASSFAPNSLTASSLSTAPHSPSLRPTLRRTATCRKQFSKDTIVRALLVSANSTSPVANRKMRRESSQPVLLPRGGTVQLQSGSSLAGMIRQPSFTTIPDRGGTFPGCVKRAGTDVSATVPGTPAEVTEDITSAPLPVVPTVHEAPQIAEAPLPVIPINEVDSAEPFPTDYLPTPLSAGSAPQTARPQLKLSSGWAHLKHSLYSSQKQTQVIPQSVTECVELLQKQEVAKFTVLAHLRAQLLDSPKEWLLEFVNNGGVSAIVHAATVCEQTATGKFNLTQVICQCQLLLCFKALMNNQKSLECIIAQDTTSMREVVQLIRVSKNLLMKIQMLDLLSAIALFSPDGHKHIMDSLEEDTGGKNFLFLCVWVAEFVDASFTRAVLSLINVLVNAPQTLDERLRIRQHFLDLHFTTTLELLQQKNFEEGDVALQTQIDVFFRELSNDAEELKARKASPCNVMDPGDIVKHVMYHVQGTTHADTVLGVLQHLLLLSQDEKKGNEEWNFVQAAIHRASVFESHADAKMATQRLRGLTDPATVPATFGRPAVVTASTETQTDSAVVTQPTQELKKEEPKEPEKEDPSSVPVTPPPPPPAPAPPPPPPAKFGKFGIRTQAKPASEYKGPVPSIKMRQFFWTKLAGTPDALHDTVWATKLAEGEVEVPTHELEELFPHSAKKTDAVSPRSPREEETQAKALTLLEPKRSNNLSIALSNMHMRQYQQDGWDVLARQVNEASEGLSPEVISILVKNMPDEAEVALLTPFAHEKFLLPTAEQFLLTMLEIPSYKEKVGMLQFRSHFDALLADSMSKIATFENAAKEIKANKHLHLVLKLILAVGNFLNCNTAQGDACGFKLETLRKLNTFRSPVQPNLSLLQFMVNAVDKYHPDAVTFYEELPSMCLAASQDMGEIVSEIAGQARLSKQHISVLDHDQHNSKFTMALLPFVQRASIEIAHLEEQSTATLHLVTSLAASFGEDTTTATCINDFFATMRDFCSSWADCHKHLMSDKKREQRRQDLEAKRAAHLASKSQSPRSNDDEEGQQEQGQHRKLRRQDSVVEQLVDQIMEGDFKAHPHTRRRRTAGRTPREHKEEAASTTPTLPLT